ncbi:replicative DNA helicase [Rhodobacteraceae bacterium NNCM2]|nr:replicative DNA helicase [Coraliihabitans acroporae]
MADGTAPAAPTLQPHNIEAEQALLGALLLNNDCFDRIDAVLQAHHFFDPVHRRIYELAARHIQRGNLASPVSLKPYLADDEGLKELGGTDYLVRLAEATISIVSVRDYARSVRDLALRRDLIRIGAEIQDRATQFDPDSEPGEQITEAEQALYTLGEKGKYEGGFVDFAKAAADAANVVNAAFQRGGGLAGISTGLAELDYKLGGLRKSDLLILAGRPSMGKTALATNIAFNVAKRYKYGEKPDGTKGAVEGGVVGFFSLEMSSEQLANRILAAEAQIKGHELLSGRIEENDFRRFLEVARDLETIKLFIDDTPALPISSLAARARRLKRTEGLDVMVIDYLQLARPASTKDQGRVNEVSEITQGLKAIAKELDIPVIALSQLSRQVEARDDKRPQLSDLRESGSIEQDADVVMFVFREEYYHERMKPAEDDPKFPEWQEKAERLFGRAEVIIGKQRHGPIGTVDLHFEGKYTKFSDPVRDNQYAPGNHAGFE